MNRRVYMAVSGFAVMTLFSAGTVDAQAEADTDGLARAVARIVADSLIPRLNGGGDPVFIRAPGTAFDSAVYALLVATSGTRTFGPRPPEAYEWTTTRGFVMEGDTAAVLVELGTTGPTGGPIDTYIEENRYLFVRDERGWRFVRREFVRGMDLGPVRG